MEYETLSKKALSVLYITAILQAVIASAVLLTGFWALAHFEPYTMMLLHSHAWLHIAVPVAVLLPAVLWAIFVPLVRFRRYRYKIAEDRVEIIEGLFYIRRTIVPLDRIHQLDIVRGPIDTRFGVAKVTLTTAGSAASFRFLELSRAEAIAETLNTAIAKKLRQNRSSSGSTSDV